MLSLGTTWELFKQTESMRQIRLSTQYNSRPAHGHSRTRVSSMLIPKTDTQRTSLALEGSALREVSVRAPRSWLPVSREFCFQETLIYTDVCYCQQGDPCFKKQHLTGPTMNLNLASHLFLNEAIVVHVLSCKYVAAFLNHLTVYCSDGDI